MSPRGSSGSDPPSRKTTPSLPDIDVLQRLGEAASLQGADITYATRRSPEEIAHSHEMERLKEQHRQRMELRSWWATVILVGLLTVVCALVAAFHPDVELRKIAAGGLLSLFTAWLGYAVGRTQSKSGS
jgi:hypothetical protein